MFPQVKRECETVKCPCCNRGYVLATSRQCTHCDMEFVVPQQHENASNPAGDHPNVG